MNSLEVDGVDGKMYWMTDTAIQRANLDGSGAIESVIVLGGSGPIGKEDFILYNAPVPEPSSLVLWTGCGLICLVAAWWRRKRRA